MNKQQKGENDMNTHILQIAKRIKQMRDQNHKHNHLQRLIIGVCGIPGSGKSTVSAKLASLIEKCVVLPLDGFHLFRKQLNQQGIKRRGAAFTFDLLKFQNKIQNIRKSQIGLGFKYPDFNHKEKDPVQDAIQILPQIEVIIVEGLYVFDKNLQINQSIKSKEDFQQAKNNEIWDFKIWVNCEIETAVSRVAKRHLQSGIQPTYELAYQRATTNDRTNGIYVQQNCFKADVFQSLSNWILQGRHGTQVILQNGKQTQL